MSVNGDGPGKRYDLSILDFVVAEHTLDRCEERLGYRLSHDEIRQECFDAGRSRTLLTRAADVARSRYPVRP
jgi:hypothetical protein